MAKGDKKVKTAGKAAKKSVKVAKNAADSAVEDASNTAAEAPKGPFTLPVIALGTIVVLVIIGAVLLLGSSGSNQQQFPSFQKVNSPVPPAFSSIQNSGNGEFSQNLAALSNGALANVTQLTITYSGTLQASGSVISISSPISINDYIYGTQRKFEINVSSIEGLGSADIAYLNITNGTYTCTNFNSSAVNSGNYENMVLGSHAITCRMTSSISGMDLGKLSEFNFSQLSQDGIQLQYNDIYQSTYMGTPCTYIAGTATAQGYGNNGGLFQMCVSDVYYVPLSMSIYGSGNGSTFALTINETAISNSSSLGSIDQIPG